MNIFNIPIKDINKVINQTLTKSTPEEVLQELIKCGYERRVYKMDNDEKTIIYLNIQMILLNLQEVVGGIIDLQKKNQNGLIKIIKNILILIMKYMKYIIMVKVKYGLGQKIL